MRSKREGGSSLGSGRLCYLGLKAEERSNSILFIKGSVEVLVGNSAVGAARRPVEATAVILEGACLAHTTWWWWTWRLSILRVMMTGFPDSMGSS